MLPTSVELSETTGIAFRALRQQRANAVASDVDQLV